MAFQNERTNKIFNLLNQTVINCLVAQNGEIILEEPETQNEEESMGIDNWGCTLSTTPLEEFKEPDRVATLDEKIGDPEEQQLQDLMLDLEKNLQQECQYRGDEEETTNFENDGEFDTQENEITENGMDEEKLVTEINERTNFENDGEFVIQENEIIENGMDQEELVTEINERTNFENDHEFHIQENEITENESGIVPEGGSTLQKKKRSGKWNIKKHNWKENDNKKKRERGAPYKGKKKIDGKLKYDIEKQKRAMKERCNCKKSLSHNSQLKCNMFTEEERQEIFKKFWKDMCWKEKRIYVRLLMTENETKRARNRKNDAVSRRRSSFKYHMLKGESKLRVCKLMFLNTHSIGEYSVLNWKTETRSPCDSDSNASPTRVESRKQTARRESLKPQVECLQHCLNNLPKMESHYCRSSTTKQYLEPYWKSKRSLYEVYVKEWCAEKNVKALSIFAFEKYFAKLNLSLFLPKKDMCEICATYEAGYISEEIYLTHQQKKKDARTEKEQDKESTNLVFAVDVQAVLLSPMSNVSANYFRTKLITHNYSIFDLKTRDGFCYLWNEAEGGVTADNFSSIICHFLENHVFPKVSEGQNIIIYSDGCTGQNRNVTLANALLNLSKLHNVTIIQKFLEVGHTQMEVDGMHSTIERKMRNVKINVPADYVQICRTARQNPKPYNVNYLIHDFFKNFSSLRSYLTIRPGKTVGDPHVTDLRALKYSAEGVIHYKLSHPEEWKELEVRARKILCVATHELPDLYTTRLPIKKSKYDHLQYLKKSLLQDYHEFYDNIPFRHA